MIDLATLADGLKPYVLRWLRPRTTWFVALNRSGGALAAGDVVVVDTVVDDSVTTSTAAGDQTVAGVVLIGGASLETVYVATAGVVDVAVTGAVTRGQWLRQSGTAKLAQAVAVGAAGGFGIAVQAAAGPGTGSVKALISVPTR